MISDYTIKAVKELPITSILDREGIPYKKVGREALALCPWHNDKNPSLTINDDKGFCYCFVCQIGRDGIGFVQQTLGLSFADTVERIALKHEIQVIYEDVDPELAALEANRKSQFIAQLKQQQESFRNFLRDSRAQRIRDFLDSRGILPSTSKFFELGYSPQGFFADRITIPIHDHIGNLIGFTGRASQDSVKPKYKNTENNEYFDKSKIVFNEHRAAQPIREADSVVFVEGHFDVISLWQYGVKNVVAMQGTAAPSEAVINRLSKKTKRFILCYDSDDGGKKAIDQFGRVAGTMACSGAITISIVSLPKGTDPDECVRKGDIDLFSAIENAIPWFDWQITDWTTDIDRSDTAAFMATEKKIKEFINSIQSPVLRQLYIDKASRLLGVDNLSIIQIAKSWTKSMSSSKAVNVWSKPSAAATRIMAEKRLIRLYISFSDARPELRPLMERIESPVHQWLWERVQECEAFTEGVELRPALMSVLAVCEPHYTRQLRSILMPTIKVKKDAGILEHTKKVLSESSLGVAS